MTPEPAVFDMIDAVVQARNERIEAIGSMFRGQPSLAPHSNAYYEVYEVKSGRPGVERLEVRLPRAGHKGPRVFVVDLGPQRRCVRSAEVIGRYGEPELSPPTPRQPPGSPTYYVYHRPWGDLRLGIAPNDCVSSVVIETRS